VGQHIRSCEFILFFNRAKANTREPIFGHKSSKDLVWYKEDPFGDKKCIVLKFGVFYHKSTPKIGRNGQLPAKINDE